MITMNASDDWSGLRNAIYFITDCDLILAGIRVKMRNIIYSKFRKVNEGLRASPEMYNWRQ